MSEGHFFPLMYSGLQTPLKGQKDTSNGLWNPRLQCLRLLNPQDNTRKTPPAFAVPQLSIHQAVSFLFWDAVLAPQRNGR